MYEGKTTEVKRLVVANIYGGRVNRRVASEIEKNPKDISVVHFPIEPFHYREPKRHATQQTMEACVKSYIPMSMETQKEVPDWAIDYLTRSKYSEIRLYLSTFDKKKAKVISPMGSDPVDMRKSFITCFNGGVYTLLGIPVVGGITLFADVFEVVDALKYWAKGINISGRSFSVAEFDEFRQLAASKKLPDISAYYTLVDGRYIIEEDYWDELLGKLREFLDGTKLNLEDKGRTE